MTISPNARPGRGLTQAAATLIARLVQRNQGVLGPAYAGFALGQGEAQQLYGVAFGQPDGRLMRLLWRDVFAEEMPSMGSRQWRTRLASIDVAPPGRGACLLASDDSTFRLNDGGALRLVS